MILAAAVIGLGGAFAQGHHHGPKPLRPCRPSVQDITRPVRDITDTIRDIAGAAADKIFYDKT